MYDKIFYIDNFRAMVSLGALNDKTSCPHQCAFCYMQDGFGEYPNAEIHDIVKFLVAHKGRFNMVYISGDTDSFAPPRTEQGLRLLSDIANALDCDITFTTRTIFKPEHIEIIRKVAELKKRQGKVLIAGISISHYSEKNRHIEPLPIPTPDERIKTLIDIKKAGVPTLLALRPFLPVVGIDEYLAILDKAAGYVDIVLGESFYFKESGSKPLERVFGGAAPEGFLKGLERTKMPVDTSKGDWLVWNSPERERAVREKAQEIGAIFSMHSRDAIIEYKQRQSQD